MFEGALIDIVRKGFTLFELLAAIAVIGILSAMVMLSSNEAVSSTRANNIINNLCNWKVAALAWYMDNVDGVDKGTLKFGDSRTVRSKDVEKYLNSASPPGYDLHNSRSGSKLGTWFITYSGADLDSNVAEKLNARKDTVGISGTNTSHDYGDISSIVYIYVR